MCSSVASVLVSRATSSPCPMMPSRRAATALHMYAPMLVVDVCTLVLPSALRMSAGSPESGSVMAAIDAHVRSAYARSGAPSRPPVVAACAVDAPTVTSSATSAATLPTLDRMRAAYPSGGHREASRCQEAYRLVYTPVVSAW